MNYEIQLALFDLDGTITDSMGVWEYACTELCKQKKIIPQSDLKTDLKSLNLPEIAEYFVTNYKLSDGVSVIYETLFGFLLEGYEKVSLKEGVTACLQGFYDSKIPCYITTASERKCVELVLEKFSLTQYFSKIIVSSEEKVSKDDAAFFEKIIKDFGVAQEKVTVFEDSLFAIKTAKKAGCKVVGIYDDFSRKNQEEIRAVADFYGLSWQDIETFLFEGKK